MLHLRLLSLLMLLLSLASAQESIGIYPFASDDIYTGAALSDALETALSPSPNSAEAAHAWSLLETNYLIPPLVVAEGYLSPLSSLTTRAQSRQGARVMRQVLGLDVVITGEVSGAAIASIFADATDSEQTTVHSTPTRADDARTTDNAGTSNDDSIAVQVYVASRYGVETLNFEGSLAQLPAVARAIALALEQRFTLAPARLEPTIPHIDDSYRDYIGVLALLHGGFMPEAAERIDTMLASDPQLSERFPKLQHWRALFDAIATSNHHPAARELAALSTNMPELSQAQRLAYFERAAEQSALPVYDLWLGVLRDEANDRLGANQAFAAAATGYDYAKAAELSYRQARNLEVNPELQQTTLNALSGSTEMSVLWALSWVAQAQGDSAQEKRYLTRMAALAPSTLYPFERLSFLAFDEDDATAAAENLRVAVELEPDSSLYWTNYGWAQYLSGDYEGSAQSSIRAIELNPNQVIAHYNLGLSRAVRGQFDDALLAYTMALTMNPQVDPEALQDLENAREMFPDEPAVRYALSYLYEADGNTDAAITSLQAFLDNPGDLNTGEAEQRLARLTTPPAQFDMPSESLSLNLAGQSLASDAVRAGDRIAPVFVLSTDGFELPRSVVVSYQLADISLSQQQRLPSNLIEYRVDGVAIDIPEDIAPGTYTLHIKVEAEDGRSSEQGLELTIGDQGNLTRQLLSRGVVLRNLDQWQPLYRYANLQQDDQALITSMQRELRSHAEIAGSELPTIDNGRFAEMDGTMLFEKSTPEDIRDFIIYVIDTTNDGIDMAFVDAYAQWALDGAPSR